jgi:hypothetical protein
MVLTTFVYTKHKTNTMSKLTFPLIIMALLISCLSFSQEMPIPISTRLTQSEYVFEGTVIESNPYYDESGKYINTSNTIEITKIFKGDIQCGTIELITRGGTVNGESTFIPHELRVIKGSSGIFLCESTNSPLSIVDFYSETNYNMVEPSFGYQSFLRYWYNGQQINIADIVMNYDSLAQVYSSVLVGTGVALIDCNVNASFTQDEPNPLGFKTEVETPYNYPIYDQSERDAIMNKIKIDFENSSHGRSGEKIFYAIRNLTITGSVVNRSIEFDITVKDNLGFKFLDLSMVRIDYGNLAFGSNIVANSGIEATRGVLNADTNCYGDVYALDDPFNPNVVNIYANEKINSTCKNVIKLYEQTIMHIKMRILNCNSGGTVSLKDSANLFFPSSVLSSSAFADSPHDVLNTYYELVEHNQTETIPDCKPNINSFSPMSVAGGIKDKLTIRGNQFGDNMGKVYFSNADGGGGMMVWTDSLDIINWTDTLIELYVPSYSEGTIGSTAQWNTTAGTGHFKVIATDYTSGISIAPLEIRYSISNNKFKNYNIIAPHFAYNGSYVLHCSGAVSVYKNGDMKAIIQKAINDWRCLTGINWTLGADVPFTADSTSADGRNTITFNQYLDPNTIAEGIQRTAHVPNGAGTLDFAREIDLEINPNYNFYCDSTSITIPQGEVDLYFAILHELGHAHGLKHVMDHNAMMYAFHNSSSNNRKIDLENDFSCDEGGSKILWVSRKVSSASIAAMVASKILVDPFPACKHFVGIKDNQDNVFDVLVYPNPFESMINISLDSDIKTEVLIELYDISGRLVLTQNKTLNMGENAVKMDTTTIQKGVYILNISSQDGNTLFSMKIIK